MMYWTLQSNNLRRISQNGQTVQHPPKVDISNRLDRGDCSSDESMILWFREGLFTANEKGAFRSVVYGVQNAHHPLLETSQTLDISLNASTRFL